MKKGIFFLLFVVASYSGSAQKSTNFTPEQILSNFFSIYEKDGPKTALDTLFSYGDKDMQKSVSYLKDTLFGTARSVGKKYSGSELIIKKNVTPSLVVYSYMAKYPTSPIRFTFIFYKADDTWRILNFSFDSNLIKDSEELTKLYNFYLNK
jgi:hypothetical protein